MSLSKKHYKAIAEIINYSVKAFHDAGTRQIATELMDYFANDNPQFDRARFRAACGLAVLPTIKAKPYFQDRPDSVKQAEFRKNQRT